MTGAALQSRLHPMNRHEDNFKGNKAELVYGDGEYHVVRRGSYVLCTVTGERILLEDLRYWHADRQEPYVDAAAALKRELELMASK